MAFTRQDGIVLADLLTKYSGQGPVDPDSRDGKEIIRLMEKLNSSYDPQARADVSFQQLVENFKLQRDLAKKRGEILDEQDLAQRTINSHRERHLNRIRARIKLLLKDAEENEEELKLLKEEYKIEAKILKVQKTTETASKKGDAMAQSLLESTLGISRSFLGGGGMKGLMGMAKGFGKGALKSLGPTQLLIDFIIKVIEQVISIDKSSTAVFQQTGMGGYAEDVAETNRYLTENFGPDAAKAAASAHVAVIQGRKDLLDLGNAKNKLALDVGRYSFVGVSADAIIDSSVFFSQNLEMTADEQQTLNRKIYQLSEQMERPPEEVFREMAQSIPVLSRYGERFPRIFFDLSRAARMANMKVADLQALVEKTDTSEDVLRASAKFNALLGGSFLNPLELLSADPGKKIKIIAEAYQKAQDVTGREIPQRVIRALYKQFGLDAKQFQNIVRTNFADFEQESEKFMAEPVTPLDAIREKFAQGLKMGDKIMFQFARLSAQAAHMLMTVLPKIMDAILDLFGIHSLGLSGGKHDKKMKAVRKSLVKDGKKIKAERTMKGLRVLAQGGTYDQMSDMFNPERMINKSGKNMIPGADSGFVPGVTTASGVPLSLLRDSSTSSPSITAAKQEDASVMNPLSPLMNYNTAGEQAAFNDKYPLVAKSFETSKDDGILLSRLATLRDKLNQYADMKVKVNFVAGNTKIGEALV